jgi:hypothetical protein
MQESEKKRILRTEMAKYKELRTRISREKADKSRKKAAKPTKKIKSKVTKKPLSAEAKPAPTTEKLVSVPKEELTGPGVSGVSYSEEIAKAVEEIKEFIHGEFESFRKALRLSLRQK